MRATRPIAVAILVAVVLFSLPLSAEAIAFRRPDSAGNITVPAGETIDDDLYVSGSSVDIRGTVLGSVFAAGNDVTIEGRVGGDVWAAGNTVDVGAETSGTVHAAGNTVTVRGRTGRDVTAAGNTVRLENGFRVGRDAALAGMTLVEAASVGRDVYASGSALTISGPVGRNVNADVEQLTLAGGADVTGDVRYRSNNEARLEPGANVAGSVRRTPRPVREAPSPATAVAFALLAWVRRLVGLVLFGLLFVLLFPTFTWRATDTIARRPLPSLGIGFAVLFLTPVALFFVFLFGLLVGGWWIALMLGALYFIAVAAATIVSAVFVGRFLLERMTQRPVREVYGLLIGLLLLTVLEAIPFFGILVRMAEVLFGLGAVTLTVFRPFGPTQTSAEAPRVATAPPPAGPVQPT